MKAHELAKILLDGPDLPISTHANNHTASSDYMRVCTMKVFGGETHVGIGNFSRRCVNGTNDFVIDEIDGGERLPDN